MSASIQSALRLVFIFVVLATAYFLETAQGSTNLTLKKVEASQQFVIVTD